MSETDCQGCQEFQEWSRRSFLKSSRSAVAAAVTAPAWLPRVVLGADESSSDTLVVVFLRGGMDSISAVVPYGDTNLYEPGLRPNIVIQPPGAPDGAIDLDGFFGLAPALAPLLDIYAANQLAVIHAAGSTDPTRSHFEAYELMEYGTPLQPDTLFSGWLARHLQVTPPIGDGLLRGLALTSFLPRTLAQAPASLPIPDPPSFDLPSDAATVNAARALLDQAYVATTDPLRSTAQSTIDTIDLLNTIDFANYAPAGGAAYAGNSFAQGLKSVAAILKAEIGLEVAIVERGGWDTHSQQGPLDGGMANNMGLIANALRAFWLDTTSLMDRTTVVVMTEFGRRVDENGSLGSDHGHGSCMFAFGGNIAGGQVIADWTSGELLHPDLRYAGDSLDVTTDYRDIFGEILQKRLNNNDLGTVFPNYTPNFRGVVV